MNEDYDFLNDNDNVNIGSLTVSKRGRKKKNVTFIKNETPNNKKKQKNEDELYDNDNQSFSSLLPNNVFEEDKLIQQYPKNQLHRNFRNKVLENLKDFYSKIEDDKTLSLEASLNKAFTNVIEFHFMNYENKTTEDTEKSFILKNNLIKKRYEILKILSLKFKDVWNYHFIKEIEYQLFVRFFQANMRNYFNQVFLLLEHRKIISEKFKTCSPAFISTLTLQIIYSIKDPVIQINNKNNEIEKAMGMFTSSTQNMKCKKCESTKIVAMEGQVNKGDEASSFFLVCLACGDKNKMKG